MHLAELSNDPLGQLSPDVTFAVNHRGSVRLARLASEAGVPRFVYMSTCSVYGMAVEAPATEESPANPLTAYAECKVLRRGRRRRAGGRGLPPDLPPQRDRLWGLARGCGSTSC